MFVIQKTYSQIYHEQSQFYMYVSTQLGTKIENYVFFQLPYYRYCFAHAIFCAKFLHTNINSNFRAQKKVRLKLTLIYIIGVMICFNTYSHTNFMYLSQVTQLACYTYLQLKVYSQLMFRLETIQFQTVVVCWLFICGVCGTCCAYSRNVITASNYLCNNDMFYICAEAAQKIECAKKQRQQGIQKVCNSDFFFRCQGIRLNDIDQKIEIYLTYYLGVTLWQRQGVFQMPFQHPIFCIYSWCNLHPFPQMQQGLHVRRSFTRGRVEKIVVFFIVEICTKKLRILCVCEVIVFFK
eukprot:TRINITY_DN1242_c0_g1_i4.p2 TRINITY_DN1242_c0_g1~~TRINITY_DN1242_c0_g1_i4.p2  ORF type:complete len:294 (+),score=-13.06 TRINITY_DN1242_c0_g1_i4:298-1179(+)